MIKNYLLAPQQEAGSDPECTLYTKALFKPVDKGRGLEKGSHICLTLPFQI